MTNYVPFTDNDLIADDWLNNLPETQRLCRELGHQIAYDHKGWVLEYSKTYGLTLWTRRCKCRRGCGYRRVDLFDPDGIHEKIGNRPDYSRAPGYLRPKGTGRMTRRDITRAKILQLKYAPPEN